MTDIKTFIQLLLYELPKNKIVWKLISSNITAEQLIYEIEVESDIGKQYITEVLRISRDIICRNSNNE